MNLKLHSSFHIRLAFHQSSSYQRVLLIKENLYLVSDLVIKKWGNGDWGLGIGDFRSTIN